MTKILLTIFLGLILFCPVSFASEDEAFFIAKESYDQKLYPTAKRLFQSFMDFYPDSKYEDEVYLYTAKAMYHSDLYEQADKYLSKISINVSNQQEVNYLIAKVKTKLLDYDAAKEFYLKSRIDGKQDMDIYYSAGVKLGELSTRFGEFENAKSFYEEILNDCDDRELKTKAYSGLAKLYNSFQAKDELQDILARWEKDLDTLEETALRNYYRALVFIRENNEFDAYVILLQALNYVTDVHVRDDIYYLLYQFETSVKKQELYMNSISSKSFSDFIVLEREVIDAPVSKQIKLAQNYLNKYADFAQSDKASLILASALYEDGRVNDAFVTYSKYLNKKYKQYDIELYYKASYGLGLVYLKKKEYDLAFEIFSKLKRTDILPQMRAALMLNATQIQENEERFDEAMRTYQEILEHDYTVEYRDYILLKMTYLALKITDYELAVELSNKLDEEFPLHPYREENLYYRSLAFYEMGDYLLADEMIASFNQLFKFSDYKNDLLKLQIRIKALREDVDADELDDFYKGLSKDILDPDLRNEIVLEQALAYLSKTEYDKAIKIFEVLLTDTESSFKEDAMYYLATAYYQNNDVESAIENYEKLLIEFDESRYSSRVRLDLARLYVYQADYGKAESILFKNIRRRNEDIIFESAEILKDVQIEQLRFSSAHQLYDQLGQRFPHRRAYCLAQKVDIAYSQSAWKSIQILGRQALEAGYESDDLYYKIAYSYEKEADYEKAIQTYNDLIYIKASSKDFVNKASLRLARIYERINKIDKAIDVYRKIIDIGESEAIFAQEQLERLKKIDSNS